MVRYQEEIFSVLVTWFYVQFMFGLVGLFGLQVGDFFFIFIFWIISLVFGAVVDFWYVCGMQWSKL
jgi:hypothetical protein